MGPKLIGLGPDFGVYSEGDGKPLERSKHMSLT